MSGAEFVGLTFVDSNEFPFPHVGLLSQRIPNPHLLQLVTMISSFFMHNMSYLKGVFAPRS